MSIVYFFPASMFVTINCLLPTESNANDFVDQIANKSSNTCTSIEHYI